MDLFGKKKLFDQKNLFDIKSVLEKVNTNRLKLTDEQKEILAKEMVKKPNMIIEAGKYLADIGVNASKELLETLSGITVLASYPVKALGDVLRGEGEKIPKEIETFTKSVPNAIIEYYKDYKNPVEHFRKYPINTFLDVVTTWNLFTGTARKLTQPATTISRLVGKEFFKGLNKSMQDAVVNVFVKSGEFGKTPAGKLFEFATKYDFGTMVKGGTKGLFDYMKQKDIQIPGIGNIENAKMIFDGLNKQVELRMDKIFKQQKTGRIAGMIEKEFTEPEQKLLYYSLQFMMNPEEIEKTLPLVAKEIKDAMRVKSLEIPIKGQQKIKVIDVLKKEVEQTAQERIARGASEETLEARKWQPVYIKEEFVKKGISVKPEEWKTGDVVPIKDMPFQGEAVSGKFKVIGWELWDKKTEQTRRLNNYKSGANLLIEPHEIELKGFSSELRGEQKLAGENLPDIIKISPQTIEDYVQNKPSLSQISEYKKTNKGSPLFVQQILKETTKTGLTTKESAGKLIQEALTKPPGEQRVVRELTLPFIRNQVATGVLNYTKDAMDFFKVNPNTMTLEKTAEKYLLQKGIKLEGLDKVAKRKIIEDQVNKLIEYGLPESLAKDFRLINEELPLRIYRIMDDVAVDFDKMITSEINKGASHAEAIEKVFGKSLDDLIGTIGKDISGAKMKSLLAVASRKTGWLVVPKQLTDTVLNKVVFNDTANKFIKEIWDTGLNVWRATTLPLRIGWHTINLVGNIGMTALSGGRLKDFLAIVSKKFKNELEKTSQYMVTTPEMELTGAPLIRKTAREMTETEKFWGGYEFKSKYSSGIQKGLETVQKFGIKPMDYILQKSYGLNAMIDAYGRQTSLIGQLRKKAEQNLTSLDKALPGMEKAIDSFIKDSLGNEVVVREAMKAVDEFYFNYIKMTDIERKFIRRYIAPFWAWYRHSVNMVAKLHFKYPNKGLILQRLAMIGNEAEKDLTEQVSGVPSEKMPEYLKGGVPIKRGETWITKWLNPLYLNEAFPSVNPVIKILAERATGAKMFPKGKEFTATNVVNIAGRRWKWDNTLKKAIPATVDDSLPPLFIHALEQFPIANFVKNMISPREQEQLPSKINEIISPFSRGETPTPERLKTFLKYIGINIQSYNPERIISSYDRQQKQATTMFLKKLQEVKK